MEPTELIQYRRALKRKNYSVHTLKNYMNILGQFSRWLSVPSRKVTRKEIGLYVDHLLGRDEPLRPSRATCKRSVSSLTTLRTRRAEP